MKNWLLHNIRMNVIQTAGNGVVNEDTFFQFSQRENIVSANYSGGKIKRGYLIGVISNNTLNFKYCQLQDDGIIYGGDSVCKLLLSDSGKIRLEEHFKWAANEKGRGINIFEEV